MENNLKLTPDAVKAIQALQHPCGTYKFYRTHLGGLVNYILNNSDKIGMSQNEAMNTLCTLNALLSDIADIAATPAQLNDHIDTFDEITLGCDNNGKICLPNQPSEMLSDVKEAWFRLKEATETLSEAIEHAKKSGERFNAVNSDLSVITDGLKASMAALDEVMAIAALMAAHDAVDPYAPKEFTNREIARISLRRAYDASVYAKQLAMYAFDLVKRDEKVTEEQLAKIEAGHNDATNAARKFNALTEQLNNTEDPTLDVVATVSKEAWESLKTARYAMFRLLQFSEKAESVEELRSLTEHIERAMVKIGEIREQEETSGTQTADTAG